MRCRGAKTLRSTCAARTAVSSSSSKAKSGTCFNSAGSHGMDHLVGIGCLLKGTARHNNRQQIQIVAERNFSVKKCFCFPLFRRLPGHQTPQHCVTTIEDSVLAGYYPQT